MKHLKLFVVMLLFSCNESSNYQEMVARHINGYLTYVCLEYHSNNENITDSNSLFFIREGGGAITYSLIVEKRESYIYAVYHWNNTTPGIRDTVFFQGFAFQMDPTSWNDIIKKSNELLEKTKEDSYSEGMTGGVYYALSHNGKSVAVNRTPMSAEYKEFSRYIIESIIEPIEKLRNNLPLQVPHHPDL